jgi:hypothetical protein
VRKAHLEYAADKIHTVRRLHRTTVVVPHAGGHFDPVVPRRIVGGLLARRSDWKPAFADPFTQCMRELDERDTAGYSWGLDIGCAVEDGGFSVQRDQPSGATVNLEISDSNVSLIYFVMRLLKQLQTVGSAPAIDYDAYLKFMPGTA